MSPDGVTNAAFSYSPFGEVLEAIDSGGAFGTDSHRRRFNDKRHDELTDLGYYGYRYFDNVPIAWTQSDPLFRFEPDLAWDSPRMAGLYSFSLQNPLRYTDPDGRVPLIVPVIGFVVRTAIGIGISYARDNLCDGSSCGSETPTPDLAINDGTGSGIGAWAGAVGTGLGNASRGIDSPLVDSSLEPTSHIPPEMGGLSDQFSTNKKFICQRHCSGGWNSRQTDSKPKLTAKQIREKNAREAVQRKYDQQLGAIPKKDIKNRNKNANRNQTRDADANELTDKELSIERSHPENRTGKTDQRMKEPLEAEKKKPQ